MTLVFTLLAITFAAAAVLWGLSSLLQPYLYSDPASQLPIRALIGGLAIGCFLTLWVFVNTRADRENKFGVLHDFSPVSVTPILKFEAVRKYRLGNGQPGPEKVVKYWRESTDKKAEFTDEDGRPFRLSDDRFVTIALLVLEEKKEKPIRFEAKMKGADGMNAWIYDTETKAFTEVGGSRFIDRDQPGLVASSSGWVIAGAIGLNVLQFVVWFVVFWPCLRYNVGHSLGLALVFSLAVMLLLMPLLFNLNKVKPTDLPVPAKAKV